MKINKKSTTVILDSVSIILVMFSITLSSCRRIHIATLDEKLIVYSKSFDEIGYYKYHYELQKLDNHYYFDLFTNTSYNWQVGDTIELTKKENAKKE